MLDYPTCLKLKEAGFPQKRVPPTGSRQADGADIWFVDGYAVTEMPASEPTLEELIEALGDCYWRLYRTSNSADRIFYSINTLDGSEAKGKTAKEAVANLYLSLNPTK